MMTVKDFIRMLKKAEQSDTLYVLGCFGAPMSEKNKVRYTNNNSFNKERSYMINATTGNTFGFDCVCLIKGILWGWNADNTKTYGGASYASNGIPDISADGMFTRRYVNGISRDFNQIKPGAVLHMPGHVGVYIGAGQVIECTPKWKNRVQITYLGNLPQYKTGNYRIWTEYGYLPCVDYSEEVKEAPVKEKVEPIKKATYHTVEPGDNLTKIARHYYPNVDVNMTIARIVDINKKTYPRITKNYICIGWKLEV